MLSGMRTTMTSTKTMDANLVKKKSKKLSWLLRHGASEIGLDMDEAGWVDVDQVLEILNMPLDVLETVVRENDKRRLELEGGRVRACQGHSVDNRAVTREGLERSWTIVTSETSVWHGTSIEAARSIAREGILAVGRTHVHLAPAVASKVGKRASVHVMLEISPARLRAAGLNLYAASNGVVLAREIPPTCVVGLQTMTKRAREQQVQLAALFEGIGA
jgi:putative RNA 2'-phosphotransferase